MPTLTQHQGEETTTSTSMGLFGKIPARGDFVRSNRSEAGRVLATWIEAATEACHLSERGLPTQTVHALFRGADSPELVAVTLAPSVDSVGRRFPLAIFRELDLASASDFPALFVALRRFHQDAAHLADRAGKASLRQLEDGLGQLAVTTPEIMAAATERARAALKHATRESHIQPMFGDVEYRRHHYAFRTLAMACERGRVAALEKPGFTLDCPCKSEAHQVAWLEAIHRMCGTLPHPPGIVWTMAPDQTSHGGTTIEAAQRPARLLVTFGSMPAMTLAFLADEPAESSKLWPLWSDSQAAIEAATTALTDEQRVALDNETATFEQILYFLSI